MSLHDAVPNNAIRVACLENQIVGFVAASPTSIAQLYVRRGFHRRGIGSRLLAWAKAQSTGTLWLYTFARNEVARALYERTSAGDTSQHGSSTICAMSGGNAPDVAPAFLNAFLWSMALSPFEALFVALLAPILDSIPTLAIACFYAPGMYLAKPLFDAIPYGGWLPALVQMSLAMIVQNFAIWAAFLWWQARKREWRAT